MPHQSLRSPSSVSSLGFSLSLRSGLVKVDMRLNRRLLVLVEEKLRVDSWHFPSVFHCGDLA